MDKKEKQAIYKVLLFSALFLLMPLVVYFRFWYVEFAFNRFEKTTVETISGTMNFEQKSYYDEFKIYQTNENKLFNPAKSIEGVSVYLKSNDIPHHLANDLDDEDYPYLEENGYKILIYINSTKFLASSIWYFDNFGNTVRIRKSKSYQ